SFADALNPPLPSAVQQLPVLPPRLSPNPIFTKYLASAALPSASPMGNSYESGICLFLAMKVSRRGETFDESNLGPRETLTVNGLKCIVDSWKEPVKFDYDLTTSPAKFIVISAGPDRKMTPNVPFAQMTAAIDRDNVRSDTTQMGQ